MQLLVTALVISRGRIQHAHSFETGSGPVTTFQVEVTPELSSRFCVLAYYVENNNDVVADTTCLEIEKAFKNNASLQLNVQCINVKDSIFQLLDWTVC